MLTTDSKDLELGYGVDKEPREQMKNINHLIVHSEIKTNILLVVLNVCP